MSAPASHCHLPDFDAPASEFGKPPFACAVYLLRVRLESVLALSLLLIAGSTVPGVTAAAERSLPRETLYTQTTNVFAEACFFKPVESQPDDLAFKLAPLILQEVPSGATNRAGAFGALTLSNGTLALDSSRLTVYAEADTVQVHGKPHARLTYAWFYSAEAWHADGGTVPFQGVRVTLSSDGQPVIWEIMADPEATILYVAQSVENAAQREFGAALPGRRYAVEPPLTNAPKVLVARVLDDGPLPMGPMVYLKAGSARVSTVLCRCMPAQVKTLAGTRTFELNKAALSCGLPSAARAQIGFAPAFWPGEPDLDASVENKLRLPSGF